MLSLNIKHGEYITISDDIVIQVLPDGGWATVLVDAPREVPVLRGKLREKIGMERPEGIHTDHHKRRNRASRSEQASRERYLENTAFWQERKRNAKAAIRRLSEIAEPLPERDEIRRLLSLIYPLTEDSRESAGNGDA